MLERMVETAATIFVVGVVWVVGGTLIFGVVVMLLRMFEGVGSSRYHWSRDPKQRLAAEKAYERWQAANAAEAAAEAARKARRDAARKH